jgi:2-hydroxy-3-oxopropionate reductase
LGSDGVLDRLRPGGLLVDMSTVQPRTARRIGRPGEARGIDLLDAPVSGGEQGAIDGTLSIMVGRPVLAVERARPVLGTLGTTVVHVGESGAGQTVKAANQMIVAGTLELVAEALVFLAACDVDRTLALEVLAGGQAGISVPVGALVAQLMGAARAQGLGDRDHSALLLVLEGLAGRSRVGEPQTGTDLHLL